MGENSKNSNFHTTDRTYIYATAPSHSMMVLCATIIRLSLRLHSVLVAGSTFVKIVQRHMV